MQLGGRHIKDLDMHSGVVPAVAKQQHCSFPFAKIANAKYINVGYVHILVESINLRYIYN